MQGWARLVESFGFRELGRVFLLAQVVRFSALGWCSFSPVFLLSLGTLTLLLLIIGFKVKVR